MEVEEDVVMPENDIPSQLDSMRPSSCCSNLPRLCYRPAYVGPNYGEKAKVLFVGLDSGTSVEDPSKALTTAEWGALVFDNGYRRMDEGGRNQAWNAHYRGCVRTAAAILRMTCETDCIGACKMKPTSECVLSYFSQTNAVKCAPPKKSMTFDAAHRVSRCLSENLFAEVEVLKPDVIVLQGRNQKSGQIHKDFERELVSGNWGKLAIESGSHFGTISWTRGQLEGQKTALALFKHPSARGKSNFEKAWVQEILPVIPRIHNLLAAIRS